MGGLFLKGRGYVGPHPKLLEGLATSFYAYAYAHQYSAEKSFAILHVND